MGGQVAPVRPSNWRQDHWSHKFSSSTNQPRPNPLSAPVRPCLAPPAKRRKQRLVSWLHENLVHVLWLHFGNRTSDPSHLRSVQLILPLQDWSSSTTPVFFSMQRQGFSVGPNDFWDVCLRGLVPPMNGVISVGQAKAAAVLGTLGSPTMNRGGPFSEFNTLCKVPPPTLREHDRLEKAGDWKSENDLQRPVIRCIDTGRLIFHVLPPRKASLWKKLVVTVKSCERLRVRDCQSNGVTRLWRDLSNCASSPTGRLL